jgi:hypothetical protein
LCKPAPEAHIEFTHCILAVGDAHRQDRRRRLLNHVRMRAGDRVAVSTIAFADVSTML